MGKKDLNIAPSIVSKIQADNRNEIIDLSAKNPLQEMK